MGEIINLSDRETQLATERMNTYREQYDDGLIPFYVSVDMNCNINLRLGSLVVWGAILYNSEMWDGDRLRIDEVLSSKTPEQIGQYLRKLARFSGTIDDLSELTGCSRRVLRLRIDSLKKNKYLRVRKKSRKISVYYPRIPGWAFKDVGTDSTAEFLRW